MKLEGIGLIHIGLTLHKVCLKLRTTKNVNIKGFYCKKEKNYGQVHKKNYLWYIGYINFFSSICFCEFSGGSSYHGALYCNRMYRGWIIQTTEIPDSKYKQDRSVMTYDEDTSGREEEDFLVAQAMEEAKNYPTYYSDLILPKMIPGMKVTYGSDGHINHITVDGEEYEVEYEITKITDGISDTYRQPNTTIIVNRTGKGVGTWPVYCK